MRLGIVILVVAYGLSQFYRSFLAVLTPVLQAELGATAQQLANASGAWFIVFAAMQIPIGWALDTIGPRRISVGLFALGGAGGTLVFALAQTPFHITLAMGLIGAGCAPVLMASYYIFARVYSARVFATLAAATIGFGSIGNIAGSVPVALAVEAIGWRATMGWLAAISGLVALLMAMLVRDPENVVQTQKGSLLELLRLPVLWPIMAIIFVNYMPAAGLRGLWAGPYAADVFGADAAQIGRMTLVMGLAMIAGSFAYGPMDRLLGTRKWVVFGGNLIAALGCFALWYWADHSVARATFLLAVIGFFGVSYPIAVAHGRDFFPPHLIGRGVTLLNLFSIGGVGLMQFATGRLYKAAELTASNPVDPYRSLFAFFGILLVLGLLAYLPSRDSRV